MKIITFNDIDEYLVCARKYFLEPHEEEDFHNAEKTTRTLLNSHFSLENPVLSIESFGSVLVSEPTLAVRDKDGWKLVLRKTAKKFGKKHLLEAAYHGYIFSSAGYHVKEVVVTSEFFTKTVDWKDGLPLLFSIIQEVTKTQAGKIPDPKPNAICKNCRHVLECTKVLIEQEDLLAIHGVNEKIKSKLARCGIFKLSDLLDLKEKCPKYYDEKLVKKAVSLLRSEVVILSSYEKLEDGVFVDVEFHSMKDFDFLFGLLKDNEYIPFLCRNKEEEKMVFGKLLNLLWQLNRPIYHYGSYEQKRFEKLAMKWNEYASTYQKIKRNFFDLYQFINKHIALPILTYSLKSVAQHFGFVPQIQFDNSRANRYFQRWLLTNDSSYLSLVLKYNEDDLRATKYILDRLNSL